MKLNVLVQWSTQNDVEREAMCVFIGDITTSAPAVLSPPPPPLRLNTNATVKFIERVDSWDQRNLIAQCCVLNVLYGQQCGILWHLRWVRICYLSLRKTDISCERQPKIASSLLFPSRRREKAELCWLRPLTDKPSTKRLYSLQVVPVNHLYSSDLDSDRCIYWRHSLCWISSSSKPYI